MRQACADVRALFLAQAARGARLQTRPSWRARRQHPAQRRVDRPGLLDTGRRGRPRRQSDRRRRAQADRRSQEPSAPAAPRLDLPAKMFGGAGLHPRHAARRHACMRASCASPTAARRSTRSTRRRSGAPPRADRVRAQRQLPRHPRRRRDRGRSRAAAAAPTMCAGATSSSRRRRNRRRRGCCSGRWSTAPSARRGRGHQGPRALRGHLFARAISRTPRSSPSCGLAHFKDGHLTVLDALPGRVSAARGARAHAQAGAGAITVQHVQGPGCYGHNGADDAAPTPRSLRCACPAQPMRVRWRREEEFGFEPVGPAMLVKVQAISTTTGGRSTGRPRSGAPRTAAAGRRQRQLLAADALPNPPPDADADRRARGERRRRHAQCRAALRHAAQAHPASSGAPRRRCARRRCAASAPCRTSTRSRCSIDELAARAGEDPVAYRLVDPVRSARARG